MYKIKVFFKDGFRNIYEADEWVEDDEELTLRKGSQIIIINKRETTVISIIEEGGKK